jgi:type I restriction enzyme, S subunit
MTNKATVELLNNHFDIALETSDGVMKLRELILTLAMKGKLVRQDPEDQPAIELLREIEERKRRMFKEGKVKSQELLPPIKQEEIPFEIPKGWEWVRLGTVGLFERGKSKHRPRDDKCLFVNGTYPLVQTGDVSQSKNNHSLITTCGSYYNDFGLAQSRLWEKGTLCITIAANIAETGFLGMDACFPDSIVAFSSLAGVSSWYIKYFIDVAKSDLEKFAPSTAQKNINLGIINELAFPLPPLSEQKRIVAKIDQLKALCDKVETERNERNNKRLKIHAAAMNNLLTAPNKKTFDGAWNFIVKKFDELYSVPENVKELKKAILQLAVTGKLVPQDPKDQPAEELLKEIQEKKKLLAKEKKNNKKNCVISIKGEELPFEIPKSWEWVKLGEIAFFENGDRSSNYPNENDHQPSGIPFFGAKDMENGTLRFDNNLRFISEEKFAELSGGKLVDNDFVFLLRGTVGKMAMFRANERFCTGFINAQMVIVRILTKKINEFLRLFFVSNLFSQMILLKVSGSAIRQMAGAALKDFLIPIPPLAEQKRIVAKVDQLMALCNQLEQSLNHSTKKQITILDAVLAKVSC